MQLQNGLIQRTLHINGVKVRALMHKKWVHKIPSRIESVIKAKKVSHIAKEAVHF